MISTNVPMVLKPLPLRLGDPGYFNQILSMLKKDIPILETVTLTSSTCPVYSLTAVERTPRDCEYFENPISILSAFQNNCKVVSSNLVDMSTKETWSYPKVLTELSRNSLLKPTPILSGFSVLNNSKCGGHSDFGHSWTQPPSKTEFSQQKNSQLKVDSKETRSVFADPVGNYYRTLKRTPQVIRTIGKIYSCGSVDCRKKFSRKEELTRHMKTHNEERAFQCESCKRKFGRKDHWKKHVSTHTDLSERRRYVCPEVFCGKRYTRSDALSRHRNAAHGQSSRLSR